MNGFKSISNLDFLSSEHVGKLLLLLEVGCIIVGRNPLQTLYFVYTFVSASAYWGMPSAYSVPADTGDDVILLKIVRIRQEIVLGGGPSGLRPHKELWEGIRESSYEFFFF